MAVKGTYRSEYQEIDESGYISATTDETGAMVIKSRKGYIIPKKFTNEDDIIRRFGVPSADYPEVFEALAFVQEAPIYVCSAVHEDARWGGAYVTSGSVTAFSGGQANPDNFVFTGVATLASGTVGTGNGVTTSFTSPALTNTPLVYSVRLKRGTTDLVVNEASSGVLSATVDITSGTINYSTKVINVTFAYPIASGEVVTAYYDYNVNLSTTTSHAFFAVSPYVDDLAINVVSTGGYKFKATLYTASTNAYLTEYNYSLIREKDGYGSNLYYEDVFNDNDYVIMKVNTGYAGATPSLTESTIVSFGGGRRGSDPTTTDRRACWDYFKKPNKYSAKIFMDANGDNASDLNTLIESYQYYSFGITIIPKGNTVAQMVTYRNNLSIDSDGLALYANWRKIYDPYNDSFAWISNIGSVGKKMAQMSPVYDGESPAGIDENGRGGQIGDWKTVEMEHDFDDFDLKDLDEAQINPIVFDQSGYGVYIAGDKTLQVASSDTSFIHTRRIDNYILEKVIKNVMRLREFRNNTTQSQLKAKAMVDEFLAPMIAKELITEVSVICDSRNNTASVKTQRKFILDIIKKSTVNNQKTLLRLTRVGQGAVISEITPL